MLAANVVAPEFTSVSEAYQWVVSERSITNAKPFHNDLNPTDSNVDGYTRLSDLLVVVKDLRATGPRSLLSGAEGEDGATAMREFVDVTGDNYLSIADALGVVRTLRGEGEPGDIVMISPRFGNGATEGGNLTVGQSFQVQVFLDDLREEDPNPNTPADDRGVVTGSTDLVYNSDLGGVEVASFLANETALPFFGPDYNTLPQIRVLANTAAPTDDAVRVHATFDVVKLATGGEIGADERLFVTLPFKVGAVDDFASVNENSTNNNINVLDNDSVASGQLQFNTAFIPDTTAFPVNVFGVTGPLPEADIMFTSTNVNVTVPGTPTLTSVSDPPNGTAVISGGMVQYTPNPMFSGTDTFTYTITYPGNVTDTATVTVQVVNTPDAPNAVNDQFTTAANAMLNQPAPGVLANDSDPDPGDTITVTAVNGTGAVNTDITLASGATVRVQANGAFVYNPTAVQAFRALGQGQSATDTFTYTISDRAIQGNRRMDTATVTITITGVNDPPVAQDDQYEVGSNETLTVNVAQGVLANDTDPDAGATLTATVLDNVDNGTLTLNANGSFTYTPNTDFEGTETWTYTVSDGQGGTDVGTVTIEVVGQPLRAVPDTVQVNEGSQDVNINAGGAITGDDLPLDNPNNPRIVRIQNTAVGNTNVTVDTDQGGTVTFDPSQANDFEALVISYTPPNADFVGTDTFTYTIDDDDDVNSPRTSTATVTINVVNVDNDPTNAMNDTIAPPTPANVVLSVPGANVSVNGVAGGNILDNDVDPDRLPLSTVAETVNSVGGAVVTIAANGSFTYNPTQVAAFRALGEGATLTDTFVYRTNDRGDMDTATVTVTVRGVNDPPTAGPGTATTNEDTAFNGNLTQFVTDPDTGETLTFTAANITTNAGATVTINASGAFTYNPVPSATLNALAAGESATDTFAYTVRDASNQMATNTVTVTITGVNDSPVAVNDQFDFDQENGLQRTLNVLANDTDPDTSDRDDLVIVNVTTPSGGGTVQIAPNGRSLLYTHANNFDGVETFQYTIEDPSGARSTATVTINIVAFVPSQLGGFVYVDKDNDGVKDSFESGLSMVTVTLTGVDFNGNVVNLTTTTDINGQYTFADLPPSNAGGYKITVGELPFMVDGRETVSTNVTNAAGNGSAPAGFSAMVSANNQIMVVIPELGDVRSTNNLFAVRGLDPRFVSLADIVAQGNEFSDSGLAAVEGDGDIGFVSAPTSAGWEQFRDAWVEISSTGTHATIHATRISNGQEVTRTVAVNQPFNGNGAHVKIIGTDSNGNRLVRFVGSAADFGFIAEGEGEADDYAQAADAVFAEGYE